MEGGRTGNEAGRTDSELHLSRRGISPGAAGRAQVLCSLGHAEALWSSAELAVLLCGQHLPIRPVPGLILLSGRPLSFTGNALSLIGIEIHSPPFSCRWGFHRKKLLLCFPSLVTVWKFTPHILLYWVKSLLEPLLLMVAKVDQLALLWGVSSTILLHPCLDLSDCFQ